MFFFIKQIARTWCLIQFFSGAVFAQTGAGISVIDFGAVPDDASDDQNAFSAAFQYAVNSGGGTVFVPAGDYQFGEKIIVDLGATNIELIGDGNGVSRLISINTGGILRFSNSASGARLTVRDLSFIAGIPGAGTAFWFDNPELSPNQELCSLYMEHVVLMPPDFSTNWFSENICGSFLRNPQFINVLPVGAYGADVPLMPTKSGFHLTHSISPRFVNCYSKNNGTGYLLQNISGAVFFDRCNAVNVRTGFVVTARAGESCSIENKNFHMNAEVCGMKIFGGGNVSVLYGAPYWTPADVPYTDISLENCSDVNIIGNMFHVHNKIPARTQIDLKGNTSGVVIQHNIFNAPGTRVRKDSDVTDVTVSENIDNPAHVW